MNLHRPRQLESVPQPDLVVTEDYRTAFRETLFATCFAGWEPSYLEAKAGESDVEDHVAARMIEIQKSVLPWISEGFDLAGKSVLEIGCGTGSATVPFALRAELVRAYDISPASLEAAKARARLLGVPRIDFRLLDGAWAQTERASEAFAEQQEPTDVVLLIALLEHLTISERLNVLRAAWKILKPDGILVIYDTPNRLAYYDAHTFLLPFFDCLPDQLAIQYAAKSSRPYFSIDQKGDVVENLYRLGRGVSYHEFDLAIGLSNLTVANDGNSEYMRHQQSMGNAAYQWALREIFRKHLPEVPLGFATPNLDLLLIKRPPVGRGIAAPTIEEPELNPWSQTDIGRQFLRLTIKNFIAGVRDPAEFKKKLRGWWNRRVLGKNK
jgi:S-adenosylmethionine-dependent methyltransferase